MIWICTFLFTVFLGLADGGWWWVVLVLVLAFLDVAYVRPPGDSNF